MRRKAHRHKILCRWAFLILRKPPKQDGTSVLKCAVSPIFGKKWLNCKGLRRKKMLAIHFGIAYTQGTWWGKVGMMCTPVPQKATMTQKVGKEGIGRDETHG